MEKFIIIGDKTSTLGNHVSLNNVAFVKYGSLKVIDILYNDTDDAGAGKYVRIELDVDASSSQGFYNYITEKIAEAWRQPWPENSPVTIGGPRLDNGTYGGEIPVLNSSGSVNCIIKAVTWN